jgi:hypothetical protein
MTPRVLQEPETPPPQALPACTDLKLRTPPNWTAVLFFAALGGVHLSIAVPAFYNHRWEGFLSLALGLVFVFVAVVSRLVHCEYTVVRSQRRIRIRTGYRRISVERSIPFAAVRGVRLTMMGCNAPLACRVEVLCDNEDLECPPTMVPREEALCLAMTMGVPLIKVMDDDKEPIPAAERLNELPSNP